MTTKFADIRVSFTVSFADDGDLELEAQAMEAAWELPRLNPHTMDLEIVGPVRDTEMPSQDRAVHPPKTPTNPAEHLTDDQLLTEVRRRSGGMFRSDVGELIQETLKQLQAEVGRLKK